MDGIREKLQYTKVGEGYAKGNAKLMSKHRSHEGYAEDTRRVTRSTFTSLPIHFPCVSDAFLQISERREEHNYASRGYAKQ